MTRRTKRRGTARAKRAFRTRFGMLLVSYSARSVRCAVARVGPAARCAKGGHTGGVSCRRPISSSTLAWDLAVAVVIEIGAWPTRGSFSRARTAFFHTSQSARKPKRLICEQSAMNEDLLLRHFLMKRRRVGGGGDSGGGVIGDDGDDVRVRSTEGEVVAWSRLAAARSAALANWVSDTGGAEGALFTRSLFLRMFTRSPRPRIIRIYHV